MPAGKINLANKKTFPILGRQTKFIIGIFSAIVTSYILYLTKDDISKLLNIFSELFIRRLALVVYFASWVTGSVKDVNLQEDALILPEKKELSKWDIIILIAFLINFLFLFYFNNYKYISIALLSFWIFNILGFMYIVMVKINDFASSYQNYYTNGDARSFAILKAVDYYMKGFWIKLRFGIGFLLVIVFCFSTYYELGEHIKQNVIDIDSTKAYALFLLSFVIFVESWQWYYRAKTSQEFIIIRKLGHPPFDLVFSSKHTKYDV